MSGIALTGVSFVVPVHNGERWLEAVLEAIFAQDDGRPFEVIAVDDASTDSSAAILAHFVDRGLVVVTETGRGAAAAINAGVRRAQHPLIAQVDQDVVVGPGWLGRLTAELDADPRLAAAQGSYHPTAEASLLARVTDLDLACRYRRLESRIDHVCTGNTVYRLAALERVGLLDESFGYAYDNDLSYRLGDAGYELAFCRDARSVHHWPADLGRFLRQQYGQGYGRLDLVARHRRRLAGDDVSGLGMILHVPATLASLAGLVLAPFTGLFGASGALLAGPAGLLLAVLAVERTAAGLVAARSFGDPAGLAFGPVHLLRDLTWAAATVTWLLRRLRGRAALPQHSMPRLRSR